MWQNTEDPADSPTWSSRQYETPQEMNSPRNTHESINMAQESSNNLNFQTRPTSMPQTQNASRNPMQANLGHPAQEQQQTVP